MVSSLSKAAALFVLVQCGTFSQGVSGLKLNMWSWSSNPANSPKLAAKISSEGTDKRLAAARRGEQKWNANPTRSKLTTMY